MQHRLLLLFTLFLGSLTTNAQLSGWNDMQAFTVHENSGTTLYDYQLKIYLNTQIPIGVGEMLPDGSDIRFSTSCSGGAELSYWIESGINTDSTVIWVKLDSIAANAYRTFYMHWGNPAATAQSSVAGTFVGPQSATDSVSNTNPSSAGDCQRGFRFSANEDLLVTSFGRNEPNGTTRYITLFENSSQAILRQIQVSGPAAQYSYADLSSPVWLTQNTEYLLEMFTPNGENYYFGASPQMGQQLTYLDMRYCNGCDQNTFPTNSLGGMHYGYPDFWYYTRNNVASPPDWSWNAFVSLLADEADICFGDSVSLQAITEGGTQPFTYSWTGNVDQPNAWSPTAAPSDTTTYLVVLTDACGYTQTDSITINVNMLPVFGITSSNDLICNGESALLSVDNTSYSFYWPSDGSTDTSLIVSPAVTTTYAAVATNQYGCTDTVYYQQTVNIPLTATQNVSICVLDTFLYNNHLYTQSGTFVDTIAGTTSCDSIVTTILTVEQLPQATHTVNVCFGDSLVVGTHTYTQSGTYIDTLSGFQSCDSVITTVLTIRADIDAQIQRAGTFLIADAGADSYQWVNCLTGDEIPGETAAVFAVEADGEYACILTVDGCEKQSNCISLADLGNPELSMPGSFLLYPVPARGNVNILSSTDEVITLFDLAGKAVMQVELIANQVRQLTTEDLTKGVYIVRHASGTERMIVE